MQRLFAGVVFLVISSLTVADELNSLILVGEREKVLQLIATSLDAEFPGGTRTNYSEGVGFRTQFKSFWTGNSELSIAISPQGKGDSLDADGYALTFRWQTQNRDGKQHAVALVNQIILQAGKQVAVKIDKDASNYKPTSEQAGKCYNRLTDSAELKPIADKVGLSGVRDQSFAMLANEALASEEEKKIIMRWGAMRDACQKGTKLYFTFWPNNPLVPIDQGINDAGNQLILGLYRGALTYGQFAKLRADLFNQYQDTRRKVIAEMQAKDAEANERARRASLEAARLMLEQQRVINETYKPPVLTAPLIVPQTQTNCITTKIGNTLQTNCN